MNQDQQEAERRRNGLFQRVIINLSRAILLGISCVVLIFIALFLTWSSSNNYVAPTAFIVIRDLLLFIVLGITIGILTYKIFKLEMTIKDTDIQQQEKLAEVESEAERLKDLFSKQIEVMYDSARALRYVGFNYYQSRIPVQPRDFDVRISREERKAFDDVCFQVTQYVRQALKTLFKTRGIEIRDDLAITIKLLFPTKEIIDSYGDRFNNDERRQIHDKRRWIVTTFRDPYTYKQQNPHREVANVLYDVEGNTAFNDLVNKGLPFFLCNNLQDKDDYRNENPKWMQNYNATLVVPIKYYDKTMRETRCLGMVAADSRNKAGHELFDSGECLHILNHAAELLANFFLTLALFHFYKEFSARKK